MRKDERVHLKLWQIGMERNAEQKRANLKMWQWIGIALVSFAAWLFIMLHMDYFGRIGAGIIAGIGVPGGIFFLFYFTYVINDYYEKSETASDEQMEEYHRKNNKYAMRPPETNKDDEV